MNAQTTTVTHYSILVGIDDYPDKPLKSCVHDVQNIKEYLESILQKSINVQILTASQTDWKPSGPARGSILWPTYDNIISVFTKVISLAKAGDYVYIHYSGHGTQKPPSGEFSNQSTGDLALVLLSGGEENHVRYLWGFELASLLKNPKKRSWDEVNSPEYRDTSMRPNWLTRPDRYAILAACGSNEEAFGLNSDGQSHGALSYFLLRAIKCVGLKKRHGDIYDHLRARFQSSGLPQNPVLYGNRNQGFFGQVNSDITAIDVSITVRQNGTLELQAGHAHGISTGDKFLLYHLGYAEGDPRSQGHSVVTKVTDARALTSDLERLDTPSVRVRTGWMARALTRYSLQRFPIRLASGLPHRDEWSAALKERSLDIHVDADKHGFAFDVVLNNDTDYDILDESCNKIINLPKKPQDQTSVSQISSILEHLARFRLARDLGNKASADSFRESFEVCVRSNGKSFSPNCLVEMHHNSIADLVVENRGEKVLYVFVYNLGPCWQVVNVYQATYAVVTLESNQKGHKRTISKKLQMKVPEQMKEKDYRSCEDIVKVFVTSQPTSFDLLELPRPCGQ
ncbi:hypothetical protein GJ744_012223 [Endocarpon pusillum]|uniref:Peptidase C14 caspase domain-containing protein n=1 Tax=Endocarpon pusillum TaxID=364733 RepID=A0A8H7ADP1_9EURO|nr:hypothetical protein GJ744_012223 [Endocarpon pusillum]